MQRRTFALVLTGIIGLVATARGQVPVPEPGPEHERLKYYEGTWEAVIESEGMESKGTSVYTLELGGLWLINKFQGDFGGFKFEGRGLEGYDPAKKKYISVWVDSMSTSPMTSEGEYDKDGKVLTMTGEGVGPDGSKVTYKSTTTIEDKDNMSFVMKMVGADNSEIEVLKIKYHRQK
jgi:hypothetical protein